MAGPGLSLGLVKKFAPTHHVAMIARRKEALDGFVAQVGGSVSAHPSDLSDPAKLAATLAEIKAAYGVCDLLLYNGSSGMTEDPTLEQSMETFQRYMHLNLFAAHQCAQVLFPEMKEAGKGTMICTGGALATHPEWGAGCPGLTAGKSALRGWVLSTVGQMAPVRFGTVTVQGLIQEGTAVSPETLAVRYEEMYSGKLDVDGKMPVETVFDGS